MTAAGDAPSTRLLTIDRGNSTLDLMLHDGDTLVARARFAAEEPRVLGQFLGLVGRGHQPQAAVGLSVVPGALEPLRAELADRGVTLRLAGTDLRCPLPVAYLEPATLGVDRWVGALAAHRRFGSAIVVDCGTALTFNAVRADGTFLGGAIAPGAGTMRAGLTQRAPGLPAAVLEARPGLPAVTTQDAVDSGVVLAFCGAVERLTSELAAAARLPHATRVLTGGEAEIYLAHGRLRFQHVPDLVHEGLRWLSRSNV